nr:unnamed protein product [Digitaria exilis]
MAAANAPIAMREALTLTSLGIAPQFVTFTHVTMESEKYICVRETSPQNSVVIIDMAMPMQPLRRPITADSALMNPNTRILALKGWRLLPLPSAPRSTHSRGISSHDALAACPPARMLFSS